MSTYRLRLHLPIRALAALGWALAHAGTVAAQAAPPTEPVADPAAADAAAEEEASAEAAPAVAPAAVAAVPPAAAPPAAPEPPAPPPPPAPGTWSAGGIPIKLTGSFFTRNEYRQHYDVLGVSAGRFQEGDFFVYRARLGLGIGPIDIGRDYSVALQFTPQASGTLGVLPTTLDTPALGLYEGYLRLAGAHFKLDAGRFMMNYGDSLVIGSLDWNEAARSFDGFRTRITPGTSGAWVDVFYTFVDEGWTAFNDPYGAGDQHFMGVYTDLGPLIKSGMALDFYALGLLSPATNDVPIDPTMPAVVADREGAFELTLGARVKDRVGIVDYRAEVGLQVGERLGAPGSFAPNSLAYQADAEVGVNLADDTLRIGLEGLYASGNDLSTTDAEGWNQLFPTGHKFLGWSDAFGARTNAASGVLHLSYKPVPELQAVADFHVFARPEAVVMDGPTGYAASELDVGLNYALGTGVKLWGLYCIYLPSTDFYPSDEALHYVEVELRYDLR